MRLAPLLGLPALAAAGLVASASPEPPSRLAVPSRAAAGGAVPVGAAAVAGFAVSGVSYLPAAGAPERIASVVLSLGPAASDGTVRIRLAPGGPWFPCDRQPSGRAICPTPDATLAGATALSVVATR